VKSILDLHGGSAAIESEVGRGTTVKLIFPFPGKLKSTQHAASVSSDA